MIRAILAMLPVLSSPVLGTLLLEFTKAAVSPFLPIVPDAPVEVVI